MCHGIKTFSCAQSESPGTPGSSVGGVGTSMMRELLKVGSGASLNNNPNNFFHVSETLRLQAKSSLV